jgi:hypothetical protein
MAQDPRGILVAVSCGMAVGPPYWQTVDIYESDECPWDGYFWTDPDDYKECGVPHIHCPTCTQALEEDCHYEVVDPADVPPEHLAEAKDYEDYCYVYAKADLGDGLKWYREDWDFEKGHVLVGRDGHSRPRGSVVERRVAGNFPTEDPP